MLAKQKFVEQSICLWGVHGREAHYRQGGFRRLESRWLGKPSSGRQKQGQREEKKSEGSRLVRLDAAPRTMVHGTRRRTRWRRKERGLI